MAVGIMILPAAGARFWAEGIGGLILASTLIALTSSFIGLLLSFHLSFPSGPTIILVAGCVYGLSVVVGPVGGFSHGSQQFNFASQQPMKRSLKMIGRRFLLVSAFALTAGLIAKPALAHSTKPIPVVSTFSILGDMVSRIGGDHISLKTLVGRDGDTHVYRPTPADARAVKEARVLFVNGLGGLRAGWHD